MFERFSTGIIAAPGKRMNMEDCYLMVNDIHVHPVVPVSLYAVFDGHGGEWCAEFIRDNF